MINSYYHGWERYLNTWYNQLRIMWETGQAVAGAHHQGTLPLGDHEFRIEKSWVTRAAASSWRKVTCLCPELFTTCCLGNTPSPEAKLFLIKFGIFLCQYLFPGLPWYFCKILCHLPSLVIGSIWSQIPEPQFHQFSLTQDVWAQVHSGKQNTLFLRNGQVFNDYNLLQGSWSRWKPKIKLC